MQSAQESGDLIIEDVSASKEDSTVRIIPGVDVCTHNNDEEMEALIQEFTLNEKQAHTFLMITEHSCTDKPEPNSGCFWAVLVAQENLK